MSMESGPGAFEMLNLLRANLSSAVVKGLSGGVLKFKSLFVGHG